MNYYIGIENIYKKKIYYLLRNDVRFCRNQGYRNIMNEIKENKSPVNIKFNIVEKRKIENMMAVQKLGKYLPKAFIYYIFTRYFFSQLNF